MIGPFIALFLETSAIHRHEGGVESPLAEDAAEKVRKLKGRDPDVRHRPASEVIGDQFVADESGNAAQEGERADGEHGAEHGGAERGRKAA